jgi:aspartyl-tRNA(Asn)/glutamyl-tRNA(Gln) amidotransferase subunit A
LRRGELTAARATERYLARIEALDGILGAYEHVAGEQALAQASAIDALLGSGTDLGPLMGVPVALKDIFAVDGMPTTAGSLVDVRDLIGREGSFVKLLKRAGCVVLGLTRTVEFALGATGTNYTRGTPRNPWDAETFRLASGSSSGSAVAMAAGLCGFTVGSDTGGSVRGPAAFCGVVGLKTTAGLWPLGGVFGFSKTFDTIGPLTRSAADAVIIVATLLDRPAPSPAALRGLRLGRATPLFERADTAVVKCIDAALDDLANAGAQVVEVAFPELEEANGVFTAVSRPDLIAHFGRDRFLASRDQMNPDVFDRASSGLSAPADGYVRALWRLEELRAFAASTMRTSMPGSPQQNSACPRPVRPASRASKPTARSPISAPARPVRRRRSACAPLPCPCSSMERRCPSACRSSPQATTSCDCCRWRSPSNR